MEVKTKLMKLNNMIKTRIVAGMTGLCLIASIQAQPDQPQNLTTAVSVAPTVPTGELPAFDIDFPGGTPKELIQYLAKATGTTPNVIIPAHVADVQIPKFKLQHVNTMQVFDALNMVADEKGSLPVRWLGSGDKGGSNRVWTLLKTPARNKVETCQVTFIGVLLESFELDDINAAIRTSWEMLGRSPTASLKFHRETQLLIAKGDEEELKLASEVLKSLHQAATVKRQADAKK